MAESRLRLRSIRFKDGRAPLRILRDPRAEARRSFIASANDAFCTHPDDCAGFALVIWGADGTSTAACQIARSNSIPSILVPDFVRNRLLAQRIESWTLDSVREDFR